MNNKILKKIDEVLNNLFQDNDIEIQSTSDLSNNPNPALWDLIEMAELVIRLSKEERG